MLWVGGGNCGCVSEPPGLTIMVLELVSWNPLRFFINSGRLVRGGLRLTAIGATKPGRPNVVLLRECDREAPCDRESRATPTVAKKSVLTYRYLPYTHFKKNYKVNSPEVPESPPGA